MKAILLIQSEGRGHLTQALIVASYLRNSRIDVCCVVTGKPSGRKLPEYFVKRINAAIHQLESPVFHISKSGKGVDILKTIWLNLSKAKKYMHSVRRLQALMDQHNPDLIVNFYEPLSAMHALFGSVFTGQRIAIGHQYLQLHDNYVFPPGSRTQQFLFKAYTRFTQIGCSVSIGLSVGYFSDTDRIKVLPPLLRPELSLLQNSAEERVILAYLVNPGFIDEVCQLAARYPDYTFRVFSDKEIEPKDNIQFYLPDERFFLRTLASCAFFLSTAGFESVCEALFLNRKVFLVPVEDHFEQQCNAFEFFSANLVQTGKSFLEFSPELFPSNLHKVSIEEEEWLQNAELGIMQIIQKKQPRNMNYPGVFSLDYTS